MPRLSTLAVFLAALVLWHLASNSGLVSTFLLPSPRTVFETLIELAGSGVLAKHTLVSLRRVVSGYLLAIAIAVPCAALFSLTPALRRLIEPLLEFLRQIPPLAMMPLLILWLGIGEAQKIGIIVLSCFFPIFLGVRGGIAAVDRKLIDVGTVCGFSRSEIMLRIVLPSALPAIVVGLRIGLGYSWRALVGAELIASSAGLGYMIVDAENLARTDIVLAGILVIGVLGLISDHLLRGLIQRKAPWLAGDLEMARA
ncbi:ABC transporter permease [Bosea sp. BH3]|nr:ABC transporter permease [Bosea sp. BH3]